MSSINTIFSYFETYNYTGTQSTSSYALPFTPLVFKPRLDSIESLRLSRKRIVWDFGDGTSVESVTATHVYNNPGRYKVTCYLYDRAGESYYDIFSQNVDIYNYLTDSISLSAPSTTTISLTAGRFTSPVLVTRSTSWQYYEIKDNTKQNTEDNFFAPPTGVPKPINKNRWGKSFNIDRPLSIITYVSGASAANYFDSGISSNLYGHLYPYSAAYILNQTTNGVTEFVEVSSFTTTSQPLYIKLVGAEIVNTAKEDIESFFCGTTGSQLVYYKDDLPTNSAFVLFGVDADTIKPFSNASTVGYSTLVSKNNNYKSLSITANGLDSEGTSSNLFPINKNKFANTKIGFVVKVKDTENFTIKNIPLITNINLALTDGTVNYPATFYADFGSLSSLTNGGFYKGYVIPYTHNLTQNVFISASCTVDNTPLTGISNTFNIYPSGGYYNIAKRGEDVDFETIFKEIATQPLFLDKKILFEDFLGSIFGSISSVQETIGKTTYEKIKNFADNNAVLDFSNIKQLLSLLKSLNVYNPTFNSVNFSIPSELGRLVNLLSINHSRLFGSANKFNENFNTYGYLNNDIYGTNLGPEVSLNYTVTAGQHLVAFEKFSGNYTYLNTYIPLCASNITVNQQTYALSAYNDTWGWGLILPNNGYGMQMNNYYLFYTYIPGIDGTINDSVINFADSNTTLSFNNSSYSTWSEKDGIISNIIAQKLYKKLNLLG